MKLKLINMRQNKKLKILHKDLQHRDLQTRTLNYSSQMNRKLKIKLISYINAADLFHLH